MKKYQQDQLRRNSGHNLCVSHVEKLSPAKKNATAYFEALHESALHPLLGQEATKWAAAEAYFNSVFTAKGNFIETRKFLQGVLVEAIMDGRSVSQMDAVQKACDAYCDRVADAHKAFSKGR